MNDMPGQPGPHPLKIALVLIVAILCLPILAMATLAQLTQGRR